LTRPLEDLVSNLKKAYWAIFVSNLKPLCEGSIDMVRGLEDRMVALMDSIECALGLAAPFVPH
jgi:hypothetical protein